MPRAFRRRETAMKQVSRLTGRLSKALTCPHEAGEVIRQTSSAFEFWLPRSMPLEHLSEAVRAVREKSINGGSGR